MEVTTVLSLPLIQFFLLIVITTIVRRALMTPGASPVASGAIVMAGGIAALDALQRLPIPVRGLTQVVALGLVVISMYIGGSYLAAWFRGNFSGILANPVDSFAIGTWVAGSSVVGQMILFALPAWHALAVGAWALAALLWLGYAGIVLHGFRIIAVNPAGRHATGRILLATVSTQSLAILTAVLFAGFAPHWIITALLALGYLFYAVGVVLIAERYLHQRHWTLAQDWDNTNCIVHGAMSITGLAALITGALPTMWIVGTWIWVLAMFVGIESIEIVRGVRRVRALGWRAGTLTYDVSQWARNFTFGMLYAFNLHLPPSLLAGTAVAALLPIRSLIVSAGQYVVVGLLLVEIGLFVFATMRLPRRLTHHWTVEAPSRPAASTARVVRR